MLISFLELSKHYASSLLLNIFHASTATFKSKKVSILNIFIFWFDFLKQLSATHVPKQAKAFTAMEISLYLQSASNDGSNPVTKIIVLFGIYGAMRLEDLTCLLWIGVDESQEGMFKITT
jgi:hypothetical protein